MIQAASLAVQVYEDLRRRIGDGRIPAGSRLSTAALSAAFGMSHTPIREALARLHADGLAEFSANRGYRVAAAPDAAAYGHWMQARIAIEVSALRLAVAPLGSTLICRLETANRAIEQITPGLSLYAEARRFAEANLEFHAALVQASGNPFLLRAWQQVAQTAQFSRTHLRAGSVQSRPAILREHGAILAALRRDDVEAAAEALRAHITDSLDRDRLLAAPAARTDNEREEHYEAPRVDRGYRGNKPGRASRRRAADAILA